MCKTQCMHGYKINTYIAKATHHIFDWKDQSLVSYATIATIWKSAPCRVWIGKHWPL